MKVICFGVRGVEKPIFEKYNKRFNYELDLRSESLSIETIELIEGKDAIICRASDKCNKEIIDKIKKAGTKYLLTRTVGIDHIDVVYAKQNGLCLARVPSYSPTAIAEVSLAMAMSLSRRTAHFSFNTYCGNFKIDEQGFAKEIKNCTVGIIGVGKIGIESAKMFKSLGAHVIGYDPYINDSYKTIIDYKELDEVLRLSDIVSVHIPYIKGQNEQMINSDFINKMKDGAILINVSRGMIQNDKDILDAIKSNKLYGVGLDVLQHEEEFFNQQHKEIKNPIVKELISLYPRVLVTPHIGSYTDEAVANMVEISFENLKEYIDTNDCKNKI